MSEITTADIDSLLKDIGAFGFADLPSGQRRQRTAELLDLAEVALINLRAANARLQAWHDVVVGQESTVSQYYDAIGRRHFTRLGETFEQIGYQCQPLIIRPQPLAKE